MKRAQSRFIILFFVLLFASRYEVITAKVQPQFHHVSPSEAAQLVEANRLNPDFVILDLRRPVEVARARIANSTALDFHSPGFADELGKLNRDKTYLLYCRSGNRSGKTFELMKGLGFKKVYNMLQGIGGWYRSGFPIIQ